MRACGKVKRNKAVYPKQKRHPVEDAVFVIMISKVRTLEIITELLLNVHTQSVLFISACYTDDVQAGSLSL
jgi:hypothetical protein